MAPTDTDIRRLRRMVAELTDSTYSDDDLSSYLSNWSLDDSEGRNPDHDDWVESYDLHAAAAEIWEEKAANYHNKHDFSADGSSFSASQMYENSMDQARYHAARSKMKTKRVIQRRTTDSDLETGTSGLLYGGIYANIDPIGEDDFDFWEQL